ncbi:MAG TPA: polysaccharide biosynthesis protein [Acidisarcina sp.]
MPQTGTARDIESAVVETFRGRTALITGAAGSIGSELARRVAMLPVERLLLLDRDENSMFELLRRFEREGAGAMVSPVLGDIRDEQLIDGLFARWRPGIVLHAAAYKHVPMMEANPCEAVINNVTGTRILADAAADHGCERFLLISTDKAVQPVSVMGATKRVAELLMQRRERSVAPGRFGDRRERDASAGGTIFSAVRFVNVSGSRGSVVPIFAEQIARGGPITVTDARMTRYFMSIEGAAELLLRAATLDQDGCLYLLEPGDPVSILDLAQRMIDEAGLPGGPIAVEVTGIRPGEKLEEQLCGDAEVLVPTAFEGIKAVRSLVESVLEPALLSALEEAAGRRDVATVMQLLHQLPIDYRLPQEVNGQPAPTMQ